MMLLFIFLSAATGWWLAAGRVALILTRHLRRTMPAPNELHDLADDLFWALVPPPFGWLIDRYAYWAVERRRK